MAIGFKTAIATFAGGLMTVGAIIGESNGTIGEGTGIALPASKPGKNGGGDDYQQHRT